MLMIRGSMGRRKLCRYLLKILLLVGVFMFVCEIAIYPIVLYKCSWPDTKGLDGDGDKDGSVGNNDKILRAMFVADTHLLGPIRGHWFDKLRREWQMYRAFQTAMGYFKPEVIFFLGDLFDEGDMVTQKYFDIYLSRFESLFYVPEDIEVYVVAGNHDMGFHYMINPRRHLRFQSAFNASSVRLLRLKETNFLLINSMAMEMDGCFLCKEALEELHAVEEILDCQQNPSSCLQSEKTSNFTGLFKSYSKPVILQHFPFYRPSDALCSGEDSAPDNEKTIPFRQHHDCLSEESSKMLMDITQPRLILSGHTHHYCLRYHDFKGQNISEYSVPSFSWRNRNDPSFFLGLFTSSDYRLSKCYMPRESTVKVVYAIGVLSLLYLLARPLMWLLSKSRTSRRGPSSSTNQELQ